MEWFVPLVALLAVLFLVGRRQSGQSLLVAAAVALALVLTVVLLERAGLWPQGWRTR
jgi:hypothetical protein